MASPERLAAVARLLAAGAWQDAEAAARTAAHDDPIDPDARRLLGIAVAAMGEPDRAAPIMAAAADIAPDRDHPCVDLALLRPPLPRPLVSRQFSTCLRLTPADAGLRLAFAGFLLEIGIPAQAEEILQEAPASAAVSHMMGLIQSEQSQFLPAIVSFEQAVAKNPDAAASWSNLGMILKIEGRFADAIAAHDRAVALKPANARFRVNRAVALLKAGLWDRAWRDYEARLELGGVPIDPLRLMPSLRPGDSLNGLTVVAMHEDGFGDTLQFLRYLPLLAGHGARVIACVPRALVRIMRTVPGVASVVTDAKRLPPHDFVCPMFSLPRVFATTVDRIPPVPELTLDPALVRHWRARLPIGGLRTGLVWAGQARPSLPGFGTLDRRRSASLAAFAPLAGVSGLSLVSLQAGPAARQVRPAGMELADPMPDVTDFADTAAIVAGLDVIVAVDTAVVHLAGLTRKPVFLLDRYDGCWRWLSGRADSPWYPRLTVFRQDRPDDWSGAIARVAASLEAMALFHGVGIRHTPLREHAFVA